MLIVFSIGVQAQIPNGCSIVVKNPTCPVPSNAAITFNFKNLNSSGDPIYTTDSLKVRLMQTKTGAFALDTAFEILAGVTEYTCSVENLPYEYNDAGVKKQHEYFATFVYSAKTVFSEFVYFDKPEYSATLSLIRGAGCADQPIGESSVSFYKGATPYAWDWYKVGDATATNHNLDAVDGLAIGDYYVRVTDAEGCTINSDTVTIQAEDMLITAQVDQNIPCKGDAVGAISFSATKNAGDYTTTINGAAESGLNLTSKSSLPAGPYLVKLTDTLGCTAETTVTVTEPAEKITLHEDSRVNLLCREIPTGSVEFSILNAVGNVTYVWGDAPTITVPSRSSLEADVAYTIVATDEAGCETTESVTLTQPATKVSIVVESSTQPTCFGESDGSITVKASGGTGSTYLYFWDDVAGTATKSGVPAGEYTIVAFDENGCSDTVVFTLTQPAAIVPRLTIDGNEVSSLALPCNGETADIAVTVTGGQGVKTFNWGDGVYGAITEKTVTAGDYSITIRDHAGCEESVSASITQPEKLVMSIAETTTIECNGETGELTATVTGGTGDYTYAWSNSSTNSTTGLVVAGTYNLTVEDEYGCTVSDSYTLTQPNAMVIAVSETQPDCFGYSNGSLTVSTTGGTGSSYSYFWDDVAGTDTKSGIPAGDYVIKAVDANACSETITYTLNQPSSMAPHHTIDGNEISNYALSCNGQTAYVVVSATGGMGTKTFNWGDGVYGSVTEKIVPAGNYAITIRDSKGCEENVSAAITEPVKLVLSIDEESNIKCRGDKGELTANVTGGTGAYAYDWSNGSTNITSGPVGAGTYDLTVEDANGCTVSDSYTLTNPDLLEMRITLTPQTCINATLGALEAAVSGGAAPYSYAWHKKLTETTTQVVGTATTLSGLEQKATYKLLLTDDNGCVVSDSVDMKKISSYQVNPKQEWPVSCPVTIDNKNTDPNTNDGKMLVNIVGGYIPFYVKISSNGTTKDFTNIYEGDDTLAYWNNNNKSNGTRPTDGIARVRLDSLPIGTYTIEVTDYRGCAKTKDIEVIHTKEMTITEMSVTPSACTKSTGSATIAVTGGKAFTNLGVKYYEYEWDNGGDTAVVEGLTIGKHFVKVSDANGCIKRDTVEIVKKSALRITAIPLVDVIHCVGGENASARANVYYEGDLTPHSYSFVWTAGNYNASTGDVTKLPKGVHKVTVTDDDGCTQTDSVTVTETNILGITTASSEDLLCYGDNSGQIYIEGLEGGVQPYSISWNTGATSSMLNNVAAGSYTVTISDQSGCSTDTTITLTQPDKVVVSIIDQEDVVCPRVCDGYAKISAAGGYGDYLYTWDDVQSTQTENANLCLGDHFVSAVDSEGCLSDTIVISTVGKTEKLRVTTATIKQPICGEVSPSGSIKVDVAGSSSGVYTYSWTLNGTALSSTINEITNLQVGVYTLHLSDNFCSFDTTFSLNSVLSATSTLNYQSSACNGDTYSVTISNEATAGYTDYKWYNEVGTVISSTTVASDLKNGNYTITALDNTGCTYSGTHTVTQKVLSVVATATDAICYGSKDGTLSATASATFVGPVTYAWYDDKDQLVSAGQTYATAGIGTYYATAYDANHASCPIKSNFIKVSQPKPIKAVGTVVTPSYCKLKNGEMKVDIVNGVSPYTYTWISSTTGTVRTTTQSALSDICGGLWTDELFTIQVEDANGCKASTAVQVPDVSNFSLTGLQIETVHCPGDATAALQVFPINGYAPFYFNWSHDVSVTTQTAEGLSAGLYSVTVTDGKGCVVKYDFSEIPDAKPLTVDVFETPEIICNGGTGNLSAKAVGTTDPFTYKWYSNEGDLLSSMQEFSNVYAGVYKVKATDKYGCESSLTPYTLEEPTMIEAEFVVQVTGCGDNDATGSILLDTIYGGLEGNEYYFRWTNEATVGDWQSYSAGKDLFIDNLTAGMYICTISNANDLASCNIHREFHTDPLVPMSITTVKTPTQCSFYAEQELEQNKPTGSIEVSGLVVSQGDYTVLADALTTDYTYEWNDANNQTGVKASNLPAGAYQVTANGSNGCTKTFNAGEIGSLVNLEIEIYSAEDSLFNRREICLEDSLELKTNTKTTYADGYSPVDPIPNTYEWKTIESNKTAVISSPYADKTWVNPETTAYTDSARVYVLYGFDGCISRPAYYTVRHYDSVGFALEVLDSDGQYVGADSVTVMKDLTYLINPVQEPWFINKVDNEDGIVSIVWRSYEANLIEKGAVPDMTTDESTYATSGYYGLYMPFEESNYFTAVATTTHGCRERALVYIDVYLDDYVPSGFSPNGDGINDTWNIPKLVNCPNAKVVVFNRWGVKVYENKLNYAQSPWNGDSMNGNALPMGTYYYVVEFNDENKTPKAVGSVSIIR